MKTGVKNLETLANIIESILFVSGKAVAISDIAEKLGVSEKEVKNEVKELQNKYGDNSGLNLLLFNKKLQFCSNPKYADQVSAVLNPIRERELSKSMLEVAAIIAYKQPVTRLDLEEIRGVNSEYAIQVLLKLNVIEIVGKKDAVGKPALFGTTDEFLKRFQISSLDELPDYDELISQIKLIHADDDDNYLYKKAEYNEADDKSEPPVGSQVGMTDLNGKVKDFFDDKNSENLKPIEDEDVPEFLKTENVEIIK